MVYLLRGLILLMVIGIFLTVALAKGWMTLPINHIHLAIPAFIYTIFAQAFVMFYFIGVSRLTKNVHDILHSKTNLNELFDEPPKDLEPYKKKVLKFVQDSNLAKRQTIPWTMMMLILGMIGFFLGGAHDTGLVSRHVHAGVVYGFLVAMMIGFTRQWQFLGRGHLLLRKLKTLFNLPDGQM